MAEKKITSLPAVRIAESDRSDFQRIAEARGIDESSLIRIAVLDLIAKEEELYWTRHAIFAGRERRSNKHRAEHCDDLHCMPGNGEPV